MIELNHLTNWGFLTPYTSLYTLPNIMYPNLYHPLILTHPHPYSLSLTQPYPTFPSSPDLSQNFPTSPNITNLTQLQPTLSSIKLA